jgi:hypothetical protein
MIDYIAMMIGILHFILLRKIPNFLRIKTSINIMRNANKIKREKI